MNFWVKSIEKKETTCPIYFIFSPKASKITTPPLHLEKFWKTSMSMVVPSSRIFIWFHEFKSWGVGTVEIVFNKAFLVTLQGSLSSRTISPIA